jgi:hypothetical protein
VSAKAKGASRDWYADVGAATRQAIERANAAKLSDGDRRVFNAAIGLLASYSRLTDHVYRGQVAAQAGGLSIPQTSRCLKKLAGLGIIVWQPVKGRKRKSLLGLPPAEKTNHEDAENESSNDGKRITQDDSLPRRHPEETSRGEGDGLTAFADAHYVRPSTRSTSRSDVPARDNGHRIIDECIRCMERKPLSASSLLCADCAPEAIDGIVTDER